jgi:hypothetical protein
LGGVHTPDQCNQHWHRVLNPKIIKGDWKIEEEKLLTSKVSEFGESSWKKVSSFIKGRTDIQCRHHFYQMKKNQFIKEKEKEIRTSNSMDHFEYIEESKEDSFEVEFPPNFIPWSESEEDILFRETMEVTKSKYPKNFQPQRKFKEIEDKLQTFNKSNVDDLDGRNRFSKIDKSSFALFQAIDYIGDEDSKIGTEFLLSLASSSMIQDLSNISVKFENIESVNNFVLKENFSHQKNTTVGEMKRGLLSKWKINEVKEFDLFFRNFKLLDHQKIEEILDIYNLDDANLTIHFRINF